MNKTEELLETLNIRIYIPSYRREAQRTLKWLDKSLHRFVSLVVDETDAKILKGRVSDAELLICPEQGKGIANVRNWILDHISGRYFFMMDDNMQFYRRTTDDLDDYHLKNIDDQIFGHNMTPEMLYDMVELMLQQKDKKCYAVALSCRQKNNNGRSFVTENERIFACYLMDKKAFDDTGLRYLEDKCKVGEDFYISLAFMTRGYKNLVMYKYCFGKPSANQKGGCSSFRTREVQEKSMRELHELFPEFVKLVTKTTKNWDNFGENRVDAEINWKEAYASSQRPKKKRLF